MDNRRRPNRNVVALATGVAEVRVTPSRSSGRALITTLAGAESAVGREIRCRAETEATPATHVPVGAVAEADRVEPAGNALAVPKPKLLQVVKPSRAKPPA